jgi:peptidoglycan/LPS O-acetylase OafA/YrhL
LAWHDYKFVDPLGFWTSLDHLIDYFNPEMKNNLLSHFWSVNLSEVFCYFLIIFVYLFIKGYKNKWCSHTENNLPIRDILAGCF